MPISSHLEGQTCCEVLGKVTTTKNQQKAQPNRVISWRPLAPRKELEMAHRQDRIIEFLCVVVVLQLSLVRLEGSDLEAISPRFRSTHLRKRWWYQKQMTSMIVFYFLGGDSNQTPTGFAESCIHVLKQLEKSKWYIRYTHQMCWIWLWVGVLSDWVGPNLSWIFGMFFRIWTHMGLVQPRFDPAVGVIWGVWPAKVRPPTQCKEATPVKCYIDGPQNDINIYIHQKS